MTVWTKEKRDLFCGRRTLRITHFNHQNGICAYCGDEMNTKKKNRDGKSMTLEHIVPQMEGGTDDVWNTIAVCYDCNHERDSFPLKWHHIVGILIAKGIDGLYPIFVNLYKYYSRALLHRWVPTFMSFSKVFL